MSSNLGRLSYIDFIDNDSIRKAVMHSKTWKEVLNDLGFDNVSNSIKKNIEKRCLEGDISIEHLPTGQGGWNKKNKQDPLNNPSVEKWKRGEISGHTGKTRKVKPFVRDYMMAKARYACQKCGWSKKNPITNSVPLQTNHIDGDSSNTKEDNLEAICPNCHSLTPNFMGLNKGRGRPGRRIILPVDSAIQEVL
jgi:5-methylcytosine-specific restriction endonuclease McrA